MSKRVKFKKELKERGISFKSISKKPKIKDLKKLEEELAKIIKS